MSFIIIECDKDGELPDDPEDNCYLNHAYLTKFAFGSQEMAWRCDTKLEAEGMAARIEARRLEGDCEAPLHYKIVEV
jgi:hypothetical protein